MPRKPMIVKLSEQDFIWLGEQFDTPEDVMKLNYSSLKTDEDKYHYFYEMMMSNPRKWEFLPERDQEELRPKLDAIIPVEVRNDGDLDRVEDYVKKNQDTMHPQAKCMMIHRMASLRKALDNQEKVQKRANGEKVFEKHLNVYKNGVLMQGDEPVGDQDLIALDGNFHKKRKQTSGMGCYSVSIEMMIRAQGVDNVTQEDIRGYRPHYSWKKLNGPLVQSKTSDIDKNFHNRSVGAEAPEMSDAALAMAPDTMMRVFTVEPFLEWEDKFKGHNKDAYIDAAVEQVKQKIRHALAVDKCPVAMNMGGHYVTITGIQGDTILVDDPSGADEDTRDLRKVVRGHIQRNNYIHVIWMTDIELTKNLKKIHGVPSDYLEVNEDGTLRLPPEPVMDNGNRYKGAQENDTVRITRYAKREDSNTEQAERELFYDGIISAETVILPKTLAMDRLKRRAKERSEQEEKRLIKGNKRLYGRDFTRSGKRSIDDTDLARNLRDLKRPAPAGAKIVSRDFGGRSMNIRNLLAVEEENRAQELLQKKQRLLFKQARDRENMEKLKLAMGKATNDPVDNRAYDKKHYIWDMEGAVVAFQVQFAMQKIEAIYKAAGKLDKLKDIKEEYDKLKGKLVPISEEDGKGIHGYENGSVHVGGVGKIDRWFKSREDITEAVALLVHICNADVRSITGQAPFTARKGNYDTYTPSLLSNAMDNLVYFTNLDRGNMLRLFAENPYYFELAERMVSVPDVDPKLLNLSKTQLEDQGETEAAHYLTASTAIRHNMQQDLNLQIYRNRRNYDAENYLADQYPSAYGNNEMMRRVSMDQLIGPDHQPRNEKAKQLLAPLKDLETMQTFQSGKSYAINNGWTTKNVPNLFGIIAVVTNAYNKAKAGKDETALLLERDTYLWDINRFLTAEPRNERNAGTPKQALAYFLHAYGKHPDSPIFAIVNEHKDIINELCNAYFKKTMEQVIAEHTPRLDQKKKEYLEKQARKKQEEEQKKKEEEKRRAEEEKKRREDAIMDEYAPIVDAASEGPAKLIQKWKELEKAEQEGTLSEFGKEAKKRFYDNLLGKKTAFFEIAHKKLLSYLGQERVKLIQQPARKAEEISKAYENGTDQNKGLPKIGAVARNEGLRNHIADQIASMEAAPQTEKLQKIDAFFHLLKVKPEEIPGYELLAAGEMDRDAKDTTNQNQALYNRGLRIRDKQFGNGEGIEVVKTENGYTVTIPEEIQKRETYLHEKLAGYQAAEDTKRQTLADEILGQDTMLASRCKAAAKLLALSKHRDELSDDYSVQNKEFSIEAHNARVQADTAAYEKDPHLESYLIKVSEQIKADPTKKDAYLAEQGRNLVTGYQSFRQKVRAQEQQFDSDQTPLITAPQGQQKDRYTIDEIRDLCEKNLSACPQIGKLSYDKHLLAAANRITLSFLVSQGAKRMFFGKGTDWTNEEEVALRDGLKADANGTYKLEDVNRAAAAMRKALLEDDAFLKTVLKGPGSKDLYESYTRRVRDTINEKTRQQESAPAVAPAENETYTLSKKDLDYYKKTRKEIATLYKSNGKYQSEYMKNLSGALDTVIRNAKTEGEDREIKISKQDMDALMKHARIYYKERQGMIFNPLTDRGKARLQVVEGMIRRNDKILKENKNPGHGPGMQA